MPTYEDFGQNVEAHLAYVHALPAAEAIEALRRRLDDGSWRDVPAQWLHRLEVTAHEHKIEAHPGVAELRASLVHPEKLCEVSH